MEYILEGSRISKTFGGITALDSVDFRLRAGEVHCLVGENGAGKSTLGKIIAGIHTPSSGILRFGETEYERLDPILAKELKIAMVTQELNLMPDLSIAENIFMFEKESYKGGFLLDRKKIIRQAAQLFEEFGLSDLPPVTTKVEHLTVAQAQIVEVMKATSQDNRILIFDEPTTALSIREVEELFKLIRRLRDQGVSIVLVTHRFSEIFEIGQVVTVLCDGKIVDSRVPIEELDHFRLVKLMVGRDIKDFFGERQHLELGDTIFEVENLSDGIKIHDVSFSVRRREIVGLAGLVGAGRTEIVETIFGIRKPVSGEVRLHGQRVDNHSIKNVINKGIVLVPEDRKLQGLAVSLPIRSNLNHVTMNMKKGFVVHEGQFAAKNREMIRSLSIRFGDIADNVNSLSGGNQQKVLLGKWLSQNASVFLFDEPTRGIDVGTKTEIYGLLRGLARGGNAVVMVSSEMQELIAICDRILVVNNGRIVTEMAAEGATEQQILEQAIAGN